MERKLIYVHSKSAPLYDALIEEAKGLGWVTDIDKPVSRVYNDQCCLCFDTHIAFNSSEEIATPNFYFFTHPTSKIYNLPEDWNVLMDMFRRMIIQYNIVKNNIVKNNTAIPNVQTDSAFLKEGDTVYVNLREICKIFNVAIHDIKLTV